MSIDNDSDSERRAYQIEIRERVRSTELEVGSLRRDIDARYTMLDRMIVEHATRIVALERAQEAMIKSIEHIDKNVEALRDMAETWRDARVIFRVTRVGGRALIVLITLLAAIATAIHYGKDILAR